MQFNVPTNYDIFLERERLYLLFDVGIKFKNEVIFE